MEWSRGIYLNDLHSPSNKMEVTISVLSSDGISGLHSFSSSQLHDYPSLLASTVAVDRIVAICGNTQWTKQGISLLNSSKFWRSRGVQYGWSLNRIMHRLSHIPWPHSSLSAEASFPNHTISTWTYIWTTPAIPSRPLGLSMVYPSTF